MAFGFVSDFVNTVANAGSSAASSASKKWKKSGIEDRIGDALEKTRDTSKNFTKSVEDLYKVDFTSATENFAKSLGSAASIVYDPKAPVGLLDPGQADLPDVDAGFETDPVLQKATRKRRGRRSRIHTSSKGLSLSASGGAAGRTLLGY